MMKNSVKNLIEFIDHSPSCFHVIENARKQFMDHGFIELKEKEYWNLEEGKSYFVTRNGSSIIAFHLPKKDFQGFHIVASHSDSPAFKIKENPEMKVDGSYVKLNVEKYGGMLMTPSLVTFSIASATSWPTPSSPAEIAATLAICL